MPLLPPSCHYFKRNGHEKVGEFKGMFHDGKSVSLCGFNDRDFAVAKQCTCESGCLCAKLLLADSAGGRGLTQ